jgi:hypothetical protein
MWSVRCDRSLRSVQGKLRLPDLLDHVRMLDLFDFVPPWWVDPLFLASVDRRGHLENEICDRTRIINHWDMANAVEDY